MTRLENMLILRDLVLINYGLNWYKSWENSQN